VEYRLDKTANVHVSIGRTSFTAEVLLENMAALMEAIKKARPSATKGVYIRKVSVVASMGPGIKLDPIAVQAIEVDV
jgi:large subunit ribosomal protein L1